MRLVQFWLPSIIAIACTSPGLAQKVIVEYDKATDFSKFHTYSWATSQSPATRPLLHHYVAPIIEGQLHAKGLEKAEHDGDLSLISVAGLDYGSNLAGGTRIVPIYGGPPQDLKRTMWTGDYSPSATTGSKNAHASLILQLVDRRSNEVIWNGTVIQDVHPSQSEELLYLLRKAITKLLDNFPPGH
jgi:hypothetical protein